MSALHIASKVLKRMAFALPVLAMDTTVAAFKKARLSRPLVDNHDLIFHSDRGAQYACKEFPHIGRKQSDIFAD